MSYGVWRLDRLGRSLFELVQLIEELGRRGVHFVSLTEAIDTSSSGGRLLFHMMAALSEFERYLNQRPVLMIAVNPLFKAI